MGKLKDYFVLIRNGANIKQDKSNIGYPITRIETISDSVIDRGKMGYAGLTDVSRYKDYILRDGDILMSHINSERHLGKTALYEKMSDEVIIHGMNLLLLRPDCSKVLSKYANYYFKSTDFRRQIPRITKNSVNQSSFTISALKELKMHAPSIEIQNKIVEVLNKAQLLIDKRKEQIQACDELIESLFYGMFGDIMVNSRGFERKKIKQLVDTNISRVSKSYLDEDYIKYIDISSIDNNTNRILDYNCYAVKDSPSRAQQCLQKGDIVYSTVRPNLKNVAMVLLEDKNLVGTSGFCVLRCNIINNQYLFRYVLSDYFTREMAAITTGANYPAIKNKDILEHYVPVPPLELQNQFAQKVEAIEHQKELLQQSLFLLEDNFNALMQRAFKGELF